MFERISRAFLTRRTMIGTLGKVSLKKPNLRYSCKRRYRYAPFVHPADRLPVERKNPIPVRRQFPCVHSSNIRTDIQCASSITSLRSSLCVTTFFKLFKKWRENNASGVR